MRKIEREIEIMTTMKIKVRNQQIFPGEYIAVEFCPFEYYAREAWIEDGLVYIKESPVEVCAVDFEDILEITMGRKVLYTKPSGITIGLPLREKIVDVISLLDE